MSPLQAAATVSIMPLFAFAAGRFSHGVSPARSPSGRPPARC